ncbi:hypothetical protein KZ770_17835 [Escherichia coli]|nr:hypothetical protein [Escherichia coli]
MAKVESETRDAVTITFAVPQPLQGGVSLSPRSTFDLKKPALMVKNYAVVTPFTAAICPAKLVWR